MPMTLIQQGDKVTYPRYWNGTSPEEIYHGEVIEVCPDGDVKVVFPGESGWLKIKPDRLKKEIEPSEIIQLMRQCSLAQIRQQLEADYNVNVLGRYSMIATFFKAAAEQPKIESPD